jgi:serine/threonine protein kinase
MAIPFLDSILSLFGGGDDLESGKKRLLKQMLKDLSKNKYSKFYKAKEEEVTPIFAKFFYEVYKVVSPAQVFMQNATKSNQLKQVTIESFMDEKLKKLQDRIAPESITERAQTTSTKDLAKQLKSELATLISGFDAQLIKTIDDCYNLILIFHQFVSFDYYFLLKKFDANLTERNFTYQPRFEVIRAEYINDDIKDFLEVALAIDPDQDWKTALAVMKNFKGDIDVVNLNQWNKLMVLIRDVKRSKIFECMARHISKDPFWDSATKLPNEHIIDAFLQKKKTDTETAINKILNDKKSAQVDQLAKSVFGTSDVDRMKYYTDKANEIFLKKGLDSFAHVQGMNYLKAFLLDYFKKDIKELCDLFLIRGQWSSVVLSQQMSDGFHSIMEITEKLLAFDETFSETGTNGSRLKAALVKADRDKGQAKYIRIIMKTGNEEAQEMINTTAQALIIIGKNFKNILEDYAKNPKELIVNWKELESISEEPLPQRVAAVYKKMYYFVQLMQFFTGSSEEGDE